MATARLRTASTWYALAGVLALVASVASLSAACARTPERESPALRARFIGNEAFEITDGTTTLLSDFPYTSGAFGYMTYDAASVQPGGEVVCLITHNHDDHFDPVLFAATSWKIVGPADVVAGVDASRVLPLSGEIVVGPITIVPTASEHAQIEHYSYLVTWHGLRLFFVGDTEATSALVAAGEVDVAFLTPWALQAMLAAGAPIPARRVVVYHHRVDEEVPTCDTCVTPSQGDVIDIPLRD